MALQVERYGVDNRRSRTTGCFPPSIQLPISLILDNNDDVKGILHGSNVSVVAKHDTELRSSTARVVLSTESRQVVLSNDLAEALGISFNADGPPAALSIQSVDPSAVALASSAIISLERGSNQGAVIIEPDEVLRCKDARLLADHTYSACEDDADAWLSFSRRVEAVSSPLAQAALSSLLDRQPVLEALLDGWIVSVAPQGQLLRLDWFGAGVTLRVRVASAAEGATVDKSGDARSGEGSSGIGARTHSVARLRAGATRLVWREDEEQKQLAFSGTTKPGTDNGSLTNVSTLLHRWVAAAAAQAPGQEHLIRKLVALIASSWDDGKHFHNAGLTPHVALLVGGPGTGKSHVSQAVALSAAAAAGLIGAPAGSSFNYSTDTSAPSGLASSTVNVYRLTSAQVYRGGVGESEAAVIRLVRHASASAARNGGGGSVIIVEDVETLLPAVHKSPLSSRVASLLLRLMSEGVAQPDVNGSGAGSIEIFTSSDRPPRSGRVFWLLLTQNLTGIDPRLLSPSLAGSAVLEVPLPSQQQRGAMLTHLLQRMPVVGDGSAAAATGSNALEKEPLESGGNAVSLSSTDPSAPADLASYLAARTNGYSPADLEGLVRTAALEAVREGAQSQLHAPAAQCDGASNGANAISSSSALMDGKMPLSPLPLSLRHVSSAMSSSQPSLLLQAIGRPPRPIPLSDLIGYPDVIAAASAAVLGPLTHGHLNSSLGVAPPRGLLIHGPGGSGKTSLAHALAHAAVTSGLANALVIQGPDVVSALVGSSEAALAALFSRARQLAPCVLVLDQFETLAPRRRCGESVGSGSNGHGKARQGAVSASAAASNSGDSSSGSGGVTKASRSRSRGQPKRGGVKDRLGMAMPSPQSVVVPPPPAAAASTSSSSNRAGDRLLSVLLCEMDGVGDSSGGNDGNSAVANLFDCGHFYCAGDGACCNASPVGNASSASPRPIHIADALPALLLPKQRSNTGIYSGKPASNSASAGSDGAGGGGPVIIVAVTSSPSLLDPAVLRPGRLDTHVATRLPDDGARAELLQHCFAKSPLDMGQTPADAALPAVNSSTSASASLTPPDSSSVPLDWPSALCRLVRETAGWSQADCVGLWTEAAMGALRRGMTSTSADGGNGRPAGHSPTTDGSDVSSAAVHGSSVNNDSSYARLRIGWADITAALAAARTRAGDRSM